MNFWFVLTQLGAAVWQLYVNKQLSKEAKRFRVDC